MLPSLVRIGLDESQDESSSRRSNGAGLPRAGRVISAREPKPTHWTRAIPARPDARLWPLHEVGRLTSQSSNVPGDVCYTRRVCFSLLLCLSLLSLSVCPEKLSSAKLLRKRCKIQRHFLFVPFECLLDSQLEKRLRWEHS